MAELTLCTVCTVVSNDSYLHERRIGGSALMSRLLVRRLAACYQAFATATACVSTRLEAQNSGAATHNQMCLSVLFVCLFEAS